LVTIFHAIFTNHELKIAQNFQSGAEIGTEKIVSAISHDVSSGYG